jgi:parvulin-like peptidyl-prolyl isomerase
MRFPISGQRLVLGLVCLGLTALAIFGARSASRAQTPTRLAGSGPDPAKATVSDTPFSPSSDYSKRVVAYIWGTIPITREDLGEYLIAREGADRLANLVNKRIIEKVAQDQGLTVTQAEIEADFAETLKGLNNLPAREFVDRVLKQYHKTLYEWKEDVIKPRILMSKMVRDKIQVTDQDLRDAFDAYYGEKIECRIILWPKGQEHIAKKVYGEIRDSAEAFERQARAQANPNLAATGGNIRPISRHTTGNEALERAAFSLHEGELSELIETPEGVVVLKCFKRTPPDTSKKLEAEREALTKEVIEKKIQAEIPKFFNKLHTEANPTLFLKQTVTEEDLIRDVTRELQSQPGKPAAGPHTNKEEPSHLTPERVHGGIQ